MITENEWFSAARDGDLPVLRQNVNTFAKRCGTDGETALTSAAMNNQPECVAFLARFEGGIVNKYSDSALYRAVQNNHPECVPFLLSEQSMTRSNGWTALHCACYWNQYECAKYLLGTVGVVSCKGETPLQMARDRKSKECIKLIENYLKDKMFRVENKNDWFIAVKAGYLDSIKKYYQKYKNLRTDKGESALMLAGNHNHKNCVEYLSQFEIGFVDQQGNTALMQASLRNFFECIPLLISELKNQNKKGNCALHNACENDCPQAAMLLLDEIDIQNMDGKLPMQIAIDCHADYCKEVLEIHQNFLHNSLTQEQWFLASKHGNLNVIKQIVLQFKGKTNSSGQTALQIAVMNNQQIIVQFLSQHECGLVDNDGWSALHHACKLGLCQCVRYLLSEHSLVNRDGKTPIQIAADNYDVECVIVLRCHTNSLTQADWFRAVIFNNLDAIKQCVQQFKGTTNNSLTALQMAVKENKQTIVEFLSHYECGMIDCDGKTALMYSASNDRSECIRYLQREIGLQDKKGKTALIYACEAQSEACIEQLLEESAIQTSDGILPQKICENSGQKEASKLIKEYAKNKLYEVKELKEWLTAAMCGYTNSIQKYSKKFQQQKNEFGQTALMLSAQFNHKDCVQHLALLECGLVDQKGKTALIYAAESNRFECVPFLITELNKADHNGWCALHYACSKNGIECAKLLVGEASTVDKAGRIPIQIAQENGNTECEQALKVCETQQPSTATIQTTLQQQMQQAGAIDLRAARQLPNKHKTHEELIQCIRASGIESIQLVLGFDFSKSNEWTGEKAYKKNLHGLDYLNPYLHVIQILEPIIPQFDEDGLIPAYRFGCLMTKDQSVVTLNYPNQQDPHFFGFEALKQGYFQAASSVKMSGPTTFAPMILQAIEIEKAYQCRQLLILILITDGNVSNIALDKQAIVEASDYPISICAIGVGDGPFDKMVEFDDMENSGRKFDNFQFVDFTYFEQLAVRIENPEIEFATLIFNEVPEHFKSMKKLGYL